MGHGFSSRSGKESDKNALCSLKFGTIQKIMFFVRIIVMAKRALGHKVGVVKLLKVGNRQVIRSTAKFCQS